MTDTPDVLTRILKTKAAEIAERSASVSLNELSARIADLPPTRGFTDAIEACIAAGDAAVIAEVKKASPTMLDIYNQISDRQHGFGRGLG